MPKKINSPEEYRKKWGVPDWSDESQYPNSHTDTIWRWEFLRRRKDYRTDYQVINKILDKLDICSDGSKELDLLFDRLTVESEKLCLKYEIDSILGAPDPRYPLQWVYGFRKMPDYDKPYHLLPPGFHAGDSERRIKHIELGKDSFYLRPTIVPHPCAAYVFDLSKPIENQISKAGVRLRKEQNDLVTKGLKVIKKRKRNDRWRDYLRILDARAESVTYRKIGEVLRPELFYNESAARIKEQHRAALNLQNNLYLFTE